MIRQQVTPRVKWGRLGCLVVGFIGVIAFLVFNEFIGNAGGDTIVDGMKCGAQMNGVHVHAHLTLFDRDHQLFLYAGIGRSQQGQCWYWVHTHDASGVIHIEGPDTSFKPTLGNFFDVWHQPLSRSQFLDYTLGPGQAMRVYVNQQPYSGNPRNIRLQKHETITIEIGPPFEAPRTYNFGTL